MENLFNEKNSSLKEEVFTELLKHKNVRIEKIISTGQTSEDWYNQEEAEWVCVLSGNANIVYEYGVQERLNAGDWIFIPAHKKHKVAYTSGLCIWLCVFIGEQ